MYSTRNSAFYFDFQIIQSFKCVMLSNIYVASIQIFEMACQLFQVFVRIFLPNGFLGYQVPTLLVEPKPFSQHKIYGLPIFWDCRKRGQHAHIQSVLPRIRGQEIKAV
jgi:hypothetical protein